MIHEFYKRGGSIYYSNLVGNLYGFIILYNKKTRAILLAGFILFAERARFELAIPFRGIHAFQARASPVYQPALQTFIL